MRIQAIKAAKYKIDYLLLAISESKDKLLEVKELTNEDEPILNINQERGHNRFNNTLDLAGGFELTETQFKKIKISAIIYLKYGLK
jgi:hypothetical protein